MGTVGQPPDAEGLSQDAGWSRGGLTPLVPSINLVSCQARKTRRSSVTLWLLHLLLCRRHGLDQPATGIADTWFALFAEGGLRLGDRFDQTSYLAFLTERHGSKGYLKALSGLVLRSYLEPTCFGSINALSAETSGDQTRYLRRSAPTERSHFPVYATYLFLIWDALYAGHQQLAIDELFEQSRCLALLGWNRETTSRWLDWMADHGLIQLDRQIGGRWPCAFRRRTQLFAVFTMN